MFKYATSGFIILILAYLIFGSKRGIPDGVKPAHIAAFADIPDDIWKSALATFNAAK